MNTLKCKYCGKEQEISDLIQHQIIEQALSTEREKHEREKSEIKKQTEEITAQKIKADFETTIKLLQQSSDDEKVRSKKLQEQVMELVKDLRKTQQEKEDMGVEMQKKLLEEQGKVREEVRKKIEEEHQLKDAEKDKKLQDVLRINEELKRKVEQGSQQTQGEVLELELETVLRKAFPGDLFAEVKKGVRGADIIQNVVDKQGRQCGIILWESKNAQWKEEWIKTLRENQRDAKAQLAVLVLANPPADISTYIYRNGVWITVKKLAVSLAVALRYNVIRVQYEKLANIGKNEKMEVLYQYIRSTEFMHRIDAYMDYFKNLKGDIDKEKRFFNTKWARQEKELQNILDNTYRMHGELQAVTGRELPDIKFLESADEQSQE